MTKLAKTLAAAGLLVVAGCSTTGGDGGGLGSPAPSPAASTVAGAPPTIASGPVLYWAKGTGKARITYLAGAGTSDTNEVDFTTQDTWGRGLNFRAGSIETAEVVVENLGSTGTVTCHVERDAKVVVEQTSSTKAVCTVMLR